MTFPQSQCTAEQYHLFDSWCFWCVMTPLTSVLKLRFCTLIFAVLLATFAQWLTSITLVRLSLCKVERFSAVLKLSNKHHMGSFYATRCKTDCLQTLYKFCKNWISVPNIVHQLTLSSPVNIGLENTQPQLFPKCYSLNSMRRSASDGDGATERSLWRQSSMTSFVSKPFVATGTCL